MNHRVPQNIGNFSSIWGTNLAQDEVAYFCEHGNEPSCSTKYREFFDYMGNY